MLYTFIVKDIYGNWFTCRSFFTSKQMAEDAALDVAEYQFIDLVRVMNSDENIIKQTKSNLN